MPASDPFLSVISGITPDLRENYFLPDSRLTAGFPLGGNNNKKQATCDIQHGRNCGSPSLRNRGNIILHHPPSPVSERFVGNGHLASQGRRTSRACAEARLATSAEAASQVISLGRAWLWLRRRPFITLETMSAWETPNQGCAGVFILETGSFGHRRVCSQAPATVSSSLMTDEWRYNKAIRHAHWHHLR